MAIKNKAVIFDMDGIIFDSERLILDCWEKVGEKYQIDNIREVCIDCTGTNSVKTREIICSYYGESFAYDTYRKEADGLFREYIRTKGMPVKKASGSFCNICRQRGYQSDLRRLRNLLSWRRNCARQDYMIIFRSLWAATN